MKRYHPSFATSIGVLIFSILISYDVGLGPSSSLMLFVSAATGSNDRGRDTFTSFFEVEFETNFGTVQDLAQATQALVTSYNKKIRQGNYENPFDIQMEEVEVLSTITNRRNLEVEAFDDDNNSIDGSGRRDLQRRVNFITVFLQGFGSCRGCRSRSRFTNDVSGRRRRMHINEVQDRWHQQKPSVDDDNDNDDGNSKRELRYFPSDGYKFGQRIKDEHARAPGSIHVQQQQDLGALPTEAEVLKEYSATVRSLDLNNIVDVTNLNEINELPVRSSNSKGSSKSSSKSSSSKTSSSKTSSSKSSSSKKGKGGSKRGGGSKRSSNSDEFTSFFEIVYETNFGTDKDIKDAAKGLISVYNDLLGDDCDDSTHGISMDNIKVIEILSDGQEQRRLMINLTGTTKTAVDEKEEDSIVGSVFNHDENDNNNRNLQRRFRRLRVFLQGFGSCGRTCPSDSRFTNDVSGRRLEQQKKQIMYERSLRHHSLHQYSSNNMFPMGVNPSIAAVGGGGRGDDSVSEDDIVTSHDDGGVCSLPTEDELLAEYSEYITSRDYSNIVDVTSLDEINKLPSFDRRNNFDSTDSNDGRNSRKLKQTKKRKGGRKNGTSYPKRGGKYKKMARTAYS